MWRRFWLTLWWTARVLAFVFIAVLGFRPSTLQLLGVGSAMIAWLSQPPVLILLTVATTLLCGDWILRWLDRRRWRALERLAVTYDLPVRDAFKYLRFDSLWASQWESADQCILQARDALEYAFRSSELVVWGRDKRRQKVPLQPIIDFDFWQGTTLHGASLSDFYDGATADTNESKGVRFRDLRVSRRQVETRWLRANWITRRLQRRKMANSAWDRGAQERLERYLKWRQRCNLVPKLSRLAARRTMKEINRVARKISQP
jgi:hypothetical protein